MSEESSPDSTTIIDQQNTTAESNTGKQGRKKTKSSVLSDEQKKAHHIASEQKRRENIRAEFDKIVSLTPNLTESENRSELNILTKSADYIDQLKDENAKLVEYCRMKGIDIPPELVYSGPKNDGSDIAK
ncbi:INO4 Protein INO4 [Candida maltosa Xu316]|uniref:Protein INO4, putative (Basic helix-loop-helix transcription factor) n=1 Tax=Candida maltosa (strain Xu316) TaxID=1245528 RepID=M3HTR0_CANMX|nr:Protein INO4, putative (Basic helix-loop-helix transcription factor) [Candida maltosa Xu316]